MRYINEAILTTYKDTFNDIFRRFGLSHSSIKKDFDKYIEDTEIDFYLNRNITIDKEQYNKFKPYEDLYNSAINLIEDKTSFFDFKKFIDNDFELDIYLRKKKYKHYWYFFDKYKVRRLEKEIQRVREIFKYKIGHIGKGKQEYCSTQLATDIAYKKEKILDYFSNTKIINTESLNEYQMLDLIKKFHNHRANEAYATIKTIEALATIQKLEWSMITLTLPPELHINPAMGKNTWNGSTPIQSHRILMRQWEKTRALLSKYKINITGIRVVEPHKDGTPHIHLVIFYHPNDYSKMIEIFKQKFPNKQFQENKGDKNKGCNFSSYAFKYVLKNMGNLEVKTEIKKEYNKNTNKIEETKNYIIDNQLRVESWRKLWGIRAFQWLGVPSLTLYRQLRKRTELINNTDKDIERLHKISRESNVYEYIVMNGGLCVKNSNRPFKLITEKELLPHNKYKIKYSVKHYQSIYKLPETTKFKVVTVIEKLFKKKQKPNQNQNNGVDIKKILDLDLNMVMNN